MDKSASLQAESYKPTGDTCILHKRVSVVTSPKKILSALPSSRDTYSSH